MTKVKVVLALVLGLLGLGIVGGIENGTIPLVGVVAACACYIVLLFLTKEKAAPEKVNPKPQKR